MFLYREPGKWDLDVGIDQVPGLAPEGVFEVWHYGRVHPREPVRPVHPDNELGPLPRAGHAHRHQEVGLDVILVPLALGRDLDGVPLGDDADVALEVALDPATRVVRVSEQRPLVVKLVVCKIIRGLLDAFWISMIRTNYAFCQSCINRIMRYAYLMNVTLLRHHSGDVQLEASQDNSWPQQLPMLDLSTPNKGLCKMQMCNKKSIVSDPDSRCYIQISFQLINFEILPQLCLLTRVIENCANVQFKMTDSISLS